MKNTFVTALGLVGLLIGFAANAMSTPTVYCTFVVHDNKQKSKNTCEINGSDLKKLIPGRIAGNPRIVVTFRDEQQNRLMGRQLVEFRGEIEQKDNRLPEKIQIPTPYVNLQDRWNYPAMVIFEKKKQSNTEEDAKEFRLKPRQR